MQILDELEIPRPCIDMEDEGYNVEWSQELKLEESAHEYVVAWALVHILPRLLGWEGAAPPGRGGVTPPLPGTLFDMSVGYNLEGITSPRVVNFMNKMEDATEEVAQIKAILRRDFPQFADIEIPNQIANSITLSTMHGCPPDEIERIAEYLLTERKLHTIVKMNPTLLGKDQVLDILHNALGFHEIIIPDSVFEHDIAYDKAVGLIGRMQKVAARQGLVFGVKLSNTLAMHNHKQLMPGDEMYMSGRALYPVTMNLFDKLAHEFNGNLRVSYSAGADALNIATIASCGPVPITACSDLLKPGGYARFGQWLENLEAAMSAAGAANLAEFSANKLANVKAAAAAALTDPRYKKEYAPYGLPKVKSGLGLWDCIVAPCMEQCAVCQDVPEYNWWIKEGDPDKALEVILARNPLPGVTGYVCNHLCQTRCVRNDYEETVAIRALKRYAEENGTAAPLATKTKGRQESGRHRLRPVGLVGRVLPGVERRGRDHLRGEGHHRRHDAHGAGVPPAVGNDPARRRPHPGYGREAGTEPSHHRRAGEAAAGGLRRRRLRRGVRGDRLPARHAAAHPRRRGAGRARRAGPAGSHPAGRAARPGPEGAGHRRRRHRHGRHAHLATPDGQSDHHRLPPHPRRDAGQP